VLSIGREDSSIFQWKLIKQEDSTKTFKESQEEENKTVSKLEEVKERKKEIV
jgi:hypothetical protein